MLLGLGTSLTIKRRRFWARIRPADPVAEPERTVMEIGGLARTDQAGYGEEFARLRTALLGNGVLEDRNQTRPDGTRDRGGSA
jgi:cytochrome c biogenesis protein